MTSPTGVQTVHQDHTRKTYAAPTVTALGSMQALTQAMMMGSIADRAGMSRMGF